MDQSEPTGAKDGPAPPGASQPPAVTIDVKQVADRVYRLMLADLRLAQARGQRAARRRES